MINAGILNPNTILSVQLSDSNSTLIFECFSHLEPEVVCLCSYNVARMEACVDKDRFHDQETL
jgi:hypothetical protein